MSALELMLIAVLLFACIAAVMFHHANATLAIGLASANAISRKHDSEVFVQSRSIHIFLNDYGDFSQVKMRYILVTTDANNLPEGHVICKYLQPLRGTCSPIEGNRYLFSVPPVIITRADETNDNIAWTFELSDKTCCKITDGICELEENGEFMAWLHEYLNPDFIASREYPIRVNDKISTMFSSATVVDFNNRRSLLTRSFIAAHNTTATIKEALESLYEESKRRYLNELRGRLATMNIDELRNIKETISGMKSA